MAELDFRNGDDEHWFDGDPEPDEREEPAESELDDEEREELVETDESIQETQNGESFIHDPVRLFMMQMGEIPLLTREQEIFITKERDSCRARFESVVYENFYAQGRASGVMQQVISGEKRLDRTVDVSTTDAGEKNFFKETIPLQQKTLDEVLKKCRILFRQALSKRNGKAKRKEAWGELINARRRGARLIEDSGLRTKFAILFFRELQEISGRMDADHVALKNEPGDYRNRKKER